MTRQLIFNAMRTPDGTVLISRHRHDFHMYEDANGETYGVDGGISYCRRIGNIQDCEDLCVYTDAPHSEQRQVFAWGTRGRGGVGEFEWKPLDEMSNDHVTNVISHMDNTWSVDSPIRKLFNDEVKFREDEKILIED